MPTDYPQAYTDITNALITAWAGTEDIFGYVPELRFADVPEKGIPEGYYARFSMLPNSEAQSTLRNGEDKRYSAFGIIIVQLFAPIDDVTAAEKLRILSQYVKTFFRSNLDETCIIFSNQRVNQLEPELKYRRANVIVEYDYDEIG